MPLDYEIGALLAFTTTFIVLYLGTSDRGEQFDREYIWKMYGVSVAVYAALMLFVWLLLRYSELHGLIPQA